MRRECLHFFPLISILLLFPALSYAATYTAASCSQADVQTAVTAEQATRADGDVISIPACSATWSGGITQSFANSVTIQGAGAVSGTTGGSSITGSDQTVLTDSAATTPLFSITTTSGKSFRITGIAFAETAVQDPGIISISGQSSAVRIDHCHFTISIGGSKGPNVGGGVTGVEDHLYIQTAQTVTNNFDFHNGENWKNDPDTNSLGNKSWADGDHYGTAQYMYVEDSRATGGYIGDCAVGSRYVFRHSSFVDTYGMANHGTAESPYRSCRAAEWYQNTFTQNTYQDGGGFQHNNGGSTLIWGNSLTNGGGYFTSLIDTNTVRQGARGMIPFPASGFGMCGDVQQSNSITESSPWDGNLNSTGYPCLDGPARGGGDLLTGYPMTSVVDSATGTRTWPNQSLQPIYIWGNSITGASFNALLADNSGTLADNRDYYQQFGTYGESGSFNGTKGIGQGLLSTRPSTCTAGPGGNTPGVGYWATDSNTLYVCNPTNTWAAYYTPYTYPHPLTQGGATDPSPPSGLIAVVQ